jgi:PPOX class probable F420-dependent enzyme
MPSDPSRARSAASSSARRAAPTLTDAAREFVTVRHLATLSTIDVDGRIHAVPVGFTLEDGILRIITGDGTQKVRNVERAGHATVSQVEGPRWITLVGAARVVRDADAVAHAVELYAARYRQPRVNPERVVIELTVDRVMASGGLKAETGEAGTDAV